MSGSRDGSPSFPPPGQAERPPRSTCLTGSRRRGARGRLRLEQVGSPEGLLPERIIACGDVNVVLRGSRHRVPAEYEWLIREGDHRPVVGSGQGRAVGPQLFDLAGLRPRRRVAVYVDRLHAPVVRPVRLGHIGGRPRVLRAVDLVDGRVEGRVRREDEVACPHLRPDPREDREEGTVSPSFGPRRVGAHPARSRQGQPP